MISLHCKWIYSLLVRLETPLYQDAAADIREIYRTTCMARWNFEQFVVSLLRSPKGKELISKISPREQSKSIQSKGVVRFSGIFDEDAQREFDDSDSINLDDLNLFSSELYHKAEDYLASLNTIISICGRYFGQEEEYVGRSSNWNMEGSNDSSYEDGEEEEEEDMEEFEDEDVL